MKLKRYKVWTHIDTGVLQIVEAKNREEAIEKAEEDAFADECQLFDNMQIGDTDILEELK